uniref:Cytochrome P450 CYP3022A1 n=1 Tax=Tigriopus japonicus TaxID=158387 RepID=A0A088DKS5_TIGJA|nr:cytochrome P450 CYP3022A1 [Tigriopus japonicus]
MLVRRLSTKVKPFETIPVAKLEDIGPEFQPNPTLKLHVLNHKRHLEYGPIYRESVGPDSDIVWIGCGQMCQEVFQQEGPYPKNLIPRPWTIYNEKYQVERGIFFKQGSDWAEWRHRLNPIFFKSQKGFWSLTDQVTLQLIRDLESDPGNLEHKLRNWAVESTLTMIFGSSFRDYQIDLDDFGTHAKNIFEHSAILQLRSADHEAKEGTDLWCKFAQSVSTSLSMTNNLTTEMLKRPSNDGLLSVLKTQSGFSDKELSLLVSDLVIASQDTVSNTALWMIHLLASNPEVQKAYQLEINQSAFVKFVIKETFRMFPVATFLTRITPNEIRVGGYSLPKDQMILMSMFHMGRRSDYFADPQKFWPSRWERSKSGQFRQGVDLAARFATIPFGFGARSCLAKHLAEYQLQFLVRELLNRFELISLNEGVDMIMKMTGIPNQQNKLFSTPRMSIYSSFEGCQQEK